VKSLLALWKWLRTPSARYSAGGLIVVGVIGGILFWGGLNTAVEWSNSLAFCANTCHEMTDNVYKEYQKTIHYKNAAGVRAICSDCHVPHEWGPKMWRKFKASFNELPHKILGTVDTPEKFNAHRLEMAERVWASMKETNSRECRNCHDINNMVFADQKHRAQEQHKDSLKTGETCIDCHKGIAHTKPKKPGEEKEEGGFSLGRADTAPAGIDTARGAS